jgi:hypothetical protein
MLHLSRGIGILPIEQILNQPPRICVAHIHQRLHLLLEFVFEEFVVDSDDSLDVDVGDAQRGEVGGVEAGFYELRAGDEPFLGGFSLL